MALHKRMLRAMLRACPKQSTYERNVRTQLTNASKTHAKTLTLLTVRVGLWITLNSGSEVT